jgi:thiol-disulfide isomerase/thioredoxin
VPAVQPKTITRYARDALIAIAVIAAISIWQTRDHLSGDDAIASVALPRLDGDTKHALPAIGRRTLIYFFAPWCGVCKFSMGNLDVLRGWFSADVVAVALAYENVDDVRRFVVENDIESTVLLGNEAMGEAFRVTSYPTYYVLDADGRVEHVSVGYSTLLGMLVRLAL